MDEGTRKAVEQGFAKQGFMQTLGAELSKVDAGTCEIRLAYSPSLTQQHGLFHGGVVATLADNAAGFAAYSLMQDGRQPLTIEFKINLMAPAMGSQLVARAEVLRSGRSISWRPGRCCFWRTSRWHQSVHIGLLQDEQFPRKQRQNLPGEDATGSGLF